MYLQLEQFSVFIVNISHEIIFVLINYQMPVSFFFS